MQSWGQNAQDHDLHGICHPTEASDETEDDLEPAKTQGIDSLGDSEWIIRYHSRGSCWHLDFSPWKIERVDYKEGLSKLSMIGFDT